MTSTTRPLETGWLADTPVEDSVFRRFLHNQAELNELLARESGGRVARTTGVSLADCRSPVAYFNQAVLLRPVTDAEDPALDVVADFWRSARGPATLLSLWPTPDLRARGWELVGHPMLVLRPPGPVRASPRPDVRVREARTEDELRTAERVAIEGYPFDEARALPRPALFPSGAVEGGLSVRIAFVGHEPAAIGNNHVAHGVVNLCLAATLPAARRKGAWSTLVWARVADADQPALAFTSDDSRPGFERMGFLPLTRLSLWVRRPRAGPSG